MKYIYTAAFVPTEDGTEYYCSVPDLPGCISTASTLEDCIDLITDAANCWLISAEDHNDPIPTPTAQDHLAIPENAILSLISVDTIKYRSETDNRAVRKTVSLPSWMDSLASKRGINCSQVLQDGLRAILES